MVSARYKYKYFRIAPVAKADEAKVFAATKTQIEALTHSASSLNTATIALQEFVHFVRGFTSNPEVSPIEVTSVNSEAVREIPGRPRWSASLSLRSADPVAQYITNNVGGLAVLYLERHQGTLNQLSAVVGIGTSPTERGDDGNESVTVELFNVGPSVPVWR